MTKEKSERNFGLLGKNISYSFSKGYFTEKFTKLNFKNFKYQNFDIQSINEFESILQNISSLKGMNVTIPYKEEVIPYLHKLDKTAKKIGAVNTIKFSKKGKLIGYNTDVIGFEKSLLPLLKEHHKKALILGTGGASKAVAYALKKNNIKYKFVSRNPSKKREISYQDLDQKRLQKYTVIINCTPLGTYPNLQYCPNIPYDFITKNHVLYDLIYNPEVSTFLANGKKNGAVIKNGYEMLKLQAEASWLIWNS